MSLSIMPIKFGDGGTFARLDQRLRKLEFPQMSALMDIVGSTVEGQTRRRIAEEKKAPDGSDWDDWSESYASKKHGNKSSHQAHPGQLRASGGHSMLQLDGGLLDSIQYEASGQNDVLIGSNLVYANEVNEERQYLGLSEQNKDDLQEVVRDFFEDLLR